MTVVSSRLNIILVIIVVSIFLQLVSAKSDYHFQLLQGYLIGNKTKLEDPLIKRMKRMAFRDRNYPLSIWTEGVPFRISPDLSPYAAKLIRKSTKFWHDNTCIDFIENGSGRNRIDFIRGQGCYSNIGRVWYKEKQNLSVGKECEHFHTITHELAHALGLFHTQNRPDRQEYVHIHEEHVERSQQSNFRVESSLACTSYDIPYEYGSVMHYRKTEFSSNKKPTVVPKDPLYEHTMGSGTGPSFFDVLLINTHYNCQDRCKTSNTECKNGGYPHPRDCSTCICPSGFAGPFCTQMMISSLCGAELAASDSPSILDFRLGSPGLRDDMYYCYWWIIAPKDSVVEIEILELEAPCWDGCLFGGLEIKAALDKRLTGYRFCCAEKKQNSIRAYGKIIPLILFTRKDYSRFKITYHTLP